MAEVVKNTLHAIFDDDDLFEKLQDLKERNGGELEGTFYLKEGSDGSGGEPIIKKVLSDERDQGCLYASGIIAMQIVIKMNDGEEVILFNNSLVNSSLSWRPLRLLFKKETTELIKMERERLDKERKDLCSEAYELFDGIKIKFVIFCSMCDMKVSVSKLPHFCPIFVHSFVPFLSIFCPIFVQCLSNIY